MLISLFGAFESGIIYAIMALGVYLTFRVLDFPDLTVDGSFVTGAAVASIAIISGIPPIIATLMAAVAVFFVCFVIFLFHTKNIINSLLSGIFMMIALYFINLMIMGQLTLALLNETTIFKQFESIWASMGINSFFNSI